MIPYRLPGPRRRRGLKPSTRAVSTVHSPVQQSSGGARRWDFLFARGELAPGQTLDDLAVVKLLSRVDLDLAEWRVVRQASIA